MRPVALVVLLCGCPSVPPDPTPPVEDADGDGAIATTDCDDADPDVHPGADETCDGVDDDCDGAVDEDATDAPTWYTDGDGDGFGDAAQQACVAPAGTVAQDGDCDDAAAAVHPGADETCGGGDEDCDGSVDEDATDAPTWYTDADGDSFGDALSAPTVACSAPPGSVADASDCDDTSATVRPGADETCGGGDEDCDGTVDEADATDATAWYPDADGDGFGDALSAPVIACTAPPGSLADATDCDDTSATVRPGADETCGGGDEDCDGTVDEADAVDATSWYPDADGDGFGDAHAAPTVACVLAGATEDASDCADADPLSFPGAEEICDDNLDQDCDGVADDRCVVTHCGTISADENWSPYYVHLVTCDVYVEGASGPNLTIENGAEVRFETASGLRRSLYVGWNAPGSLLVDGGFQRVLFTSDDPAPAPGDWGYVAFGLQDLGSRIETVDFEYGGLTTLGGTWGTLRIAGSGYAGTGVTVDDVTVRDSGTSGITVSAYSELTVSGSEIVDNAEHGLVITDHRATLGPFVNVVVTGNGLRPVSLWPDQVGALDRSSSYDGNGDDRVEIRGIVEGTVTTSASWQDLGVPYHATAGIAVTGAAAPELTLEPGVEIRFVTSARIYVLGPGRLLSLGTAGEPVVLTSDDDVPAPGGWQGIDLWSASVGSVFEHTEIRYAGGDGGGGPGPTGAVEMYPCNTVASQPSMTDTTIADSASAGIHASGGCVPSLVNMTYANNAGGDVVLLP